MGCFIGNLGNFDRGSDRPTIPSQVERRVDAIAGRLQQPLETFEAIYAKSLELLLWLNNEPGSMFAITSATPIFGIELSLGRARKMG